MFLPCSAWVWGSAVYSLRFIKKNYLLCLAGYCLSPNWLVWWLLLKISHVLSFSIPGSSAYSYFHYRLHHHPPCPVASALLILGWSWAAGAGRTLSLSPPRSAEGYRAAAQFPSYSFKPAGMERRRKQGVGGGGGDQRSYPLCLKSDPIYLLIFLHLHSSSFLVRLVLGYWWEWREHSLLLGRLQ